ncbi:hypothetical protein Mal4_09840 [Maioricimonas rarisocia]|uniref:Uncharacterized protein n=1 Tax=Maioricimonas rarisocia TaxID=2528026 RepID=A0A517Z2K2_9PLAN|nr:hypothetical protein [Maioricimonas rarisocia]QDU36696.1 hypothetical protein Mal4_09840 [Maioricimonas rarisocia]
MQHRSHSWLIPSLIASAALVLSADDARSQDAPTIDEVIAAFETREQQVFHNESLLIRYERVESDDVLPSKASGGLLPAEWKLAFRGDKWFLERRFTTPGEREDFTIPDKPKTQVVRDRMQVEWRQTVGTAFINEFGLGGNMYAGLAYTDFLGLDVPRRIARSGQADIEEVRQTHRGYVDQPFLPEFLKENRDHYSVVPEPQTIDGAECWAVVWDGMDEILVDPALGFAIRRRSYHWGPGKPMRFHLEFKEFEEVQPGLWLPTTVYADMYASIVAEAESLWGKVTNKTTYRLNEAEFNSVPDELFALDLPEGTRVVDVPRGIKYTITAASADPFGAPIEGAKKLLAESETRSASFWSQYRILIGIGGLVVVLSAAFLWKRLQVT